MSRDAVCLDLGHIWRISSSSGYDSVSCARCYQHLSVLCMLTAYIERHPRDQAFDIRKERS
jgi:hypothetical protein